MQKGPPHSEGRVQIHVISCWVRGCVATKMFFHAIPASGGNFPMNPFRNRPSSACPNQQRPQFNGSVHVAACSASFCKGSGFLWMQYNGANMLGNLQIECYAGGSAWPERLLDVVAYLDVNCLQEQTKKPCEKEVTTLYDREGMHVRQASTPLWNFAVHIYVRRENAPGARTHQARERTITLACGRTLHQQQARERNPPRYVDKRMLIATCS